MHKNNSTHKCFSGRLKTAVIWHQSNSAWGRFLCQISKKMWLFERSNLGYIKYLHKLKFNQGACFKKCIYMGANVLKKPSKNTHERKPRQMHLQITLQVSEQKMLPLTHSHWSIKRDVCFILAWFPVDRWHYFAKPVTSQGLTYINIATSVK